MTLRHLRIFLAVCESDCNATRAAEALHMTQPAVSLAIRELEQHFGAALFDRVGRRLRLTLAGERLRSHARRAEALLDEMEMDVRGRERSGWLRVGASITIGARFLADYARAYARARPGAQLRARVAPQPQLEGHLLEGSLDIALMEGVPRSPALISEEYMSDRLALLGAPERFAGAELTLEALRRQKFLLRERGSGTREQFDRATEGVGFRAEPAWESADASALIAAAAAGLGVAVLPRRMAEGALRRGEVAELRAEGLNLRRSLCIVRHRDKLVSPALEEFIEICREAGRSAPGDD